MAKLKPRKLKNTFSWMNPKLEVRDTGKFGKGVFAGSEKARSQARWINCGICESSLHWQEGSYKRRIV